MFLPRISDILNKMPSKSNLKAPYDRLRDAEDDTAEYDEFKYTDHSPKGSRNLVVGLCGIIVVVSSAFLILLWQYIQGPSQLQCAKLNSPYCK